METLNTIWNSIAPYVAILASSGVLSTIICGVLKGAFNKTINKINVEKISEMATDKGIEKIKSVSFKQSIQPLVESELKKFYEQAVSYTENTMGQTNQNLLMVVGMFEALAGYFDNSIGVSEEAKEKLKEAINLAKSSLSAQEITKTEEVIEPIVEKAEIPLKLNENHIDR